MSKTLQINKDINKVIVVRTSFFSQFNFYANKIKDHIISLCFVINDHERSVKRFHNSELIINLNSDLL